MERGSEGRKEKVKKEGGRGGTEGNTEGGWNGMKAVKKERM